MKCALTQPVIDRTHRIGAYQRLHSMGRYDRERPMKVRFRDYRDSSSLEKAGLFHCDHPCAFHTTNLQYEV